MDDVRLPGPDTALPAPATQDSTEVTPILTHPESVVASKRPTWQIVLMLAWPVLMQQFLVLLVGLSDSFLAGNYRAVSVAEEYEAAGHRLMGVGQFGGATWLAGPAGGLAAITSWQSGDLIMGRQIALQAAQTTAMYLAWFLSSIMVLVTVGSTALVARSVGAGDRPAAVHFTNQSLVLAGTFGVVGTVLGLTFIDEFIWLLQLRGQAATYAVEYLQPMFALLVFQVVELAGIACLVGAGDTRTGLWVMTGVAVVNLPLSWGLCIGIDPLPQLGFVGISWGTALSHTMGGLVVLAVLSRGRFGLRLDRHLLRPDVGKMRRLLRVSVPAAVDSISVLAGQFWFLSIVNQLGEVASSAHGVAIRWESLGFLSGAAFGTAAMTLVGQNLGAEKPERAAHSGWVAFAIGCVVMSVMGLVFYTLARPMFFLFFPHPWQLPSVEAGVPVLQLVAFAMPFLASAIIFTNALRGAGDTAFPVLFTWVGFLLVRIPLAYWLTLPELHLPGGVTLPGWDMGLFGAWLAMFADLVLRGLLFLYRFASGAWKRIKV
jgi:putative MATE family efflux protein